MLLSLFIKCCSILSKHFNYQPQITWLILLVLLSRHQQISSDAKPTKWSHSTQRRFMWKQMDGALDGFVDRVVLGTRAMRSMIGDFISPHKMPTNIMNYYPTETTRIKYIIRNPQTKETKVIRAPPSKSLVKLISTMLKPLLLDKATPIHTNSSSHAEDIVKMLHSKDPELITSKTKYIYMTDPDKLRQLEKEQELIAEHRVPIRSETKPLSVAKETEKSSHNNIYTTDIVVGKEQNLDGSWQPVYKLGHTPTAFTTSKPYMMSALHTSIVGGLLPIPQKQVYDPLIANDFATKESKKLHPYEVNEYINEESDIQPYSHKNFNHKATPASLSQQDISLLVTEIPNAITQSESDLVLKTIQKEYNSKHEYLLSRENHRQNGKISTFSPFSTTTTTEEPNYPEIFLKKLRNQTEYNRNSEEKQHIRSPELSNENKWLPSNTTHASQRVKQIPYHQHLTSISTTLRSNSQDWTQDAADTSLNFVPLSANEISATTKAPILQEITNKSLLRYSDSWRNLGLKNPHYTMFDETKHRSLRSRGSVKYGDKLRIENP